jgi:small subunit ribosomal protein S8
MLTDPLAKALSDIINVQKIGRNECVVTPVSKVIKKVLTIMKEKRYLGEYEEITEKTLPYLKINLIGTLNKCAVIKPRFSVKKGDYEKFEKRYLPAKGIGFIIVSTSKGMMTHDEAKEKGLGGSLIAYFY